VPATALGPTLFLKKLAEIPKRFRDMPQRHYGRISPFMLTTRHIGSLITAIATSSTKPMIKVISASNAKFMIKLIVRSFFWRAISCARSV